MTGRAWTRSILRTACFSATLALSCVCPALARPVPVTFPIAIESPKPSSAIGFAREASELGSSQVTPLLIQPLKFDSAVKTAAEIPIHFQSSKDPVVGGRGARWDFIVPPGSILVGAMMGTRKIFCTSKILDDSYVTHSDIAICAADDNDDGTFDALYLSDEGFHRIRSVAEIKYIEDDAVTPISTAYEPLEGDAIPALELQTVLSYSGNFLGKVQWLAMGVCWPPSLTLPSPGNEVSISCGMTDWKNDFPSDPITFKSQMYRADAVRNGRLAWGPLAVTLTGAGKDMTGAATSLPPGRAIFMDVGEAMRGNDTRQEMALFHIFVLPPDMGKAKTRAPI